MNDKTSISVQLFGSTPNVISLTNCLSLPMISYMEGWSLLVLYVSPITSIWIVFIQQLQENTVPILWEKDSVVSLFVNRFVFRNPYN